MAAAARRKRWEEHDFYDILGVACDASQDEIKRGFRTSAWLSSAQQAKELGGSENQRDRERERGGHAAICSVPSILGQTQFLVVTPTFAE